MPASGVAVNDEVVDHLLAVLLLVLLLGAAPLLEIDFENSSQVLGYLLCVPVFGLLLVGLGGLAWTAVIQLRPATQYGVFLCHHKGGAGGLCRLMKILVARHTSTGVFLDCDQLESLDFLFDVIRKSTKSVVVVLTPELLKRARSSVPHACQEPFCHSAHPTSHKRKKVGDCNMATLRASVPAMLVPADSLTNMSKASGWCYGACAIATLTGKTV